MITALARRLGITRGLQATIPAPGQLQLPVTAHAGRSRLPTATRLSVEDPVAEQPRGDRERGPAEHAALVATLRRELGLQLSELAHLLRPRGHLAAQPVRCIASNGGRSTRSKSKLCGPRSRAKHDGWEIFPRQQMRDATIMIVESKIHRVDPDFGST